MKICNGCGLEKPFSDYYLRKGKLVGKCKQCVCEIVKRNRDSKIEHYRAYDRARAGLPHRDKKEYQASESGKLAKKKTRENYKRKHPERIAAVTRANNAVISGELIPWPTCAMPDCDCKPEIHHPDYSRPLDVVWLCSVHHRSLHKMAREIERSKRGQ